MRWIVMNEELAHSSLVDCSITPAGVEHRRGLNLWNVGQILRKRRARAPQVQIPIELLAANILLVGDVDRREGARRAQESYHHRRLQPLLLFGIVALGFLPAVLAGGALPFPVRMTERSGVVRGLRGAPNA